MEEDQAEVVDVAAVVADLHMVVEAVEVEVEEAVEEEEVADHPPGMESSEVGW